MAHLFPFQAYRYNKDIVPDLGRAVTQPYDKISPQMQEEYYRRSPYSAVQITKSLEKNQNPDTEYPAAAATLRRWIEQGVLVQDTQPAIYVYYQDYEIDSETKTRKGFIALLDLKHSASGILPHERTLAGPKVDRLRLMRSTECNDDLIFMLYTDDRLAVNQVLDAQASGCAPEIEVKDDFGALHRVWPVTARSASETIQEAMAAQELFIADGHHRFETSLNYMKECEARGWVPAGPESFDKRMVACFNTAGQGVTILPTHRLVRDLRQFNSRAFLKAAEEYFDSKEEPSPEALWAAMKEGRRLGHIFGFYPGDTKRFYSLRLKREARLEPLMPAYGEAYRDLDVSILHTVVLEKLLAIDEAKLVAEEHVDFARDREGCIRKVNEGKYQASFFLNPTSVEQVQRVASLGERMPQKSTDFYPKLLTGLLFMKMKISKP
jgi:uncharacterized protein (DUF1015 family)